MIGLARRRGRGYALLMVLLLSVCSGLILAVMMDDQARVRRQGQAEVRAYLVHHAQAGLRDLLELAVRLRGLPLAEIRGDKPAVLTLRTQTGEQARFELRDGQGGVLWDATQSGGPVLTRAAAILFEELGPGAERLLRSRGPARISINAADRAVLRAVMLALDPEAKADAFADRVIELRQAKPLIEGQITPMVALAELKPAVAAYAVKLFTTDVVVFDVSIDVRGPGSRATYRGLFQADQRTTAPTAFLTFDEVPAAEFDAQQGDREAAARPGSPSPRRSG